MPPSRDPEGLRIRGARRPRLLFGDLRRHLDWSFGAAVPRRLGAESGSAVFKRRTPRRLRIAFGSWRLRAHPAFHLVLCARLFASALAARLRGGAASGATDALAIPTATYIDFVQAALGLLVECGVRFRAPPWGRKLASRQMEALPACKNGSQGSMGRCAHRPSCLWFVHLRLRLTKPPQIAVFGGRRHAASVGCARVVVARRSAAIGAGFVRLASSCREARPAGACGLREAEACGQKFQLGAFLRTVARASPRPVLRPRGSGRPLTWAFFVVRPVVRPALGPIRLSPSRPGTRRRAPNWNFWPDPGCSARVHVPKRPPFGNFGQGGLNPGGSQRGASATCGAGVRRAAGIQDKAVSDLRRLGPDLARLAAGSRRARLAGAPQTALRRLARYTSPPARRWDDNLHAEGASKKLRFVHIF